MLRIRRVTRWLSQTTYGPTDIWRQAKPLIRQAEARRPTGEFAVLIVNDSVLETAHTAANELICTHWNHRQQRYVKGLNFVSLLYQAGELALPIAVELVRKTVPVYQPKTQKTSYRSPFTKNEYLQQMLRVALPGWPQQQVAYRYLLADSWYASAGNMALVRALGHHVVFALESSRTVALSDADRAQGRFQAVQSLVFPDTQPLRVYLRAVQQAVLVTRQVFTNQDGSQGMLYLVSSDTDLDQAQLTTIYQRR
nr:transposase [Hymenobacter frigidus]